MSTDYGLKLAQQMFPNVRPLPWPPDQPIAQIEKNAEGKYSVFLFGVTQTYVTKGGLRLFSGKDNWYAYNADLITGTHLFDTLYEADSAYVSYCKMNERNIGEGKLVYEMVVIKKYFAEWQLEQHLKISKVEFKEEESEGYYSANVIVTMGNGIEIQRTIEVEEQAIGSNFVKHEKPNAIADMIKKLLEQVLLIKK